MKIKPDVAITILRDMQKHTSDTWKHDALELAIEALQERENDSSIMDYRSS